MTKLIKAAIKLIRILNPNLDPAGEAESAIRELEDCAEEMVCNPWCMEFDKIRGVVTCQKCGSRKWKPCPCEPRWQIGDGSCGRCHGDYCTAGTPVRQDGSDIPRRRK
jgi:hypothetical protein